MLDYEMKPIRDVNVASVASQSSFGTFSETGQYHGCVSYTPLPSPGLRMQLSTQCKQG